MSQNRSHAVMGQRQGELIAKAGEDFPGQADLDDFPTQPWATRALLDHVRRKWSLPHNYWAGCGIWEPAANRGFMARPLTEHCGGVWASDIHDYGAGYPVHDFLSPEVPRWLRIGAVDWIITNPPFKLGFEFITRALAIANRGVAILVRTQFLEGGQRYRDLYSVRAPSMIAQFVERVPMIKGRCANYVIDPATGGLEKVTTATAYTWLIWRKLGNQWMTMGGEAPFSWIAPCRERLELPTDYPEPGPK